MDDGHEDCYFRHSVAVGRGPDHIRAPRDYFYIKLERNEKEKKDIRMILLFCYCYYTLIY